MAHATRRQRGGYFPAPPDSPRPLVMRVIYRSRFSDVDPMAVVWHGRYANLFEIASEELGRRTNMSYADFHRDRLQAPIVQLHVDYFAPIILGEEISIAAKLIWCEGARINTEFEIHRESGSLAAAGYTVQMLIDESGMPLLATPALIENCRRKWRAGEFRALQ